MGKRMPESEDMEIVLSSPPDEALHAFYNILMSIQTIPANFFFKAT
jgi:hypothetical protein